MSTWREIQARALEESHRLRAELPTTTAPPARRPAGPPLPEVAPGETLTSFWVDAECPRCAGALVAQAAGVPTGLDAAATARCSACGNHFLLRATIHHVPELGRGRRAHPDTCGCRPCGIRRARTTPEVAA